MSNNAGATASPEMTGERRSDVAPLFSPFGAPRSHVGSAISGAGVEPEAPLSAPLSRQFNLTRIPLLPPQVQRKASVSSPEDPLEREADEVADKVMRMAEPGSIGSTPVAVQRKCAACEDEEEKTIQTKRSPAASAQHKVAQELPAVIGETLRSGRGEPLDAETRTYFEPRFGHDFGHVRVHTDPRAAESAREVSALAYTVGSQVVFGAGQYAPGTHQGRRLLAHELTHVVQQAEGPRSASTGPVISRASEPTLQRDADDFRILGKNERASTLPNQVFFQWNSAELDAAERAKLDAFASAHEGTVTLVGYASEEGKPEDRKALAERRVASVGAALRAPGRDYKGTIKLRVSAGSMRSSEGKADYRAERVVVIVPTDSKTAAPSQGSAEPKNSYQGPCTGSDAFMKDQGGKQKSDFQASRQLAINLVAATMKRLDASIFIPDEDDSKASTDTQLMAALVQYFGRGADPLRIYLGLKNIATYLDQKLLLDEHLRCFDAHEGDCGDEKMMAGQRDGYIVLCPLFFKETRQQQARSLIHEVTHVPPGPAPRASATSDKGDGAKDYAYHHDRTIRFLSTEVAEKNADSWALFIIASNGLETSLSTTTPIDDASKLKPASARAGQPPVDTQDAAQRSLAWLEKWVEASVRGVTHAYESVNDAIKANRGLLGNGMNLFKDIDNFFELTKEHPLDGDVPLAEHRNILAAILDRFTAMRMVFLEQMSFEDMAAGEAVWSGKTIRLGPRFFELPGLLARIRSLLAALAATIPHISKARIVDYVETADALRRYYNVAPSKNEK